MSTTDIAHPLRCDYRGCPYRPLPGTRTCGKHRAYEPVHRDSIECRYPLDISGQHDHVRCVLALHDAGSPGGKCARLGCWGVAGPTGYCPTCMTTQESTL